MGRLAIFLLLIVCTHASARGYAQLVSFSGRNVPLQTVFNSLEKQTGMSFFYNYSLLKDTKPVTADFKDILLEDALSLVLKGQGLSFYTSGKTIFIIKEKSHVSEIAKTQSAEKTDMRGKVLNDHGEVLAGASVIVKNGKGGTTTDEKGLFELKNLPVDAILEISFTGYQRKVIKNDGTGMMTIVLAIAGSVLDETQVIAYGSTTRRLNTGDVTTVKSDEIEREPVSNPIIALEGRVPGLLIEQPGGLPGSAGIVQAQLRGINSIQHGSDPLYLIDGVPYTSQTPLGAGSLILNDQSGNPFNFLNPADIESIDILKDADATAIYGSRGANGVILITTKKGKEGNTRIDMNLQNGFGKVAHEIKLLNTSQYLEMRHEAFENDGTMPNPNVDYDLTLWDTTRNTDWQKALLGGTAQYSDVQLSVSGGNSNTQFSLDGSFHKETTVFPCDWNDEKGSVHITINNTAFDKRLKLFMSANYVLDNNNIGQTDPATDAFWLPPDAPPLYNRDGSLNWAPGPTGISTWPLRVNPAALLLQTVDVNTNNLVANAGISYRLLRGLDVKTTMGYTNMQITGLMQIPFVSLDPSIWSSFQRTSTFSDSRITSYIFEPQLSYQNQTGKGTLTALAGTTIEENMTTASVWLASGFTSDQQMMNILDATSITAGSATSIIYRYNAAFGRINYNWDDKYLANLTARRDGSSRFGPDNRFANFYAIGGAWIFSKEGFVQRSLPQLSFGKLRASYGTTGNDQVGDYTYLDLYSNIPNIGVPYQGATGILPTSFYTPGLQWELTRKTEVGLELGVLKDRILLSSSYFLNHSSNQLIGYLVPSITGFSTEEKNLPALVENKGLELELNTVNIRTKNFRWTSSFNYTRSRNTLLRIAPGMGGYYLLWLGHSLFSNNFYHFAGVDPIHGMYQFLDAHGNLVTNPNPNTDKTHLLNPLFPDFYGGFQNSIRYKTFQLDFLFNFVVHINQEYLNYGIPGMVNLNQSTSVLKRWQRPGDVTGIEKFSENASLFNSYVTASQSDQLYVNGNFLRLKNLSFSYSISTKTCQHVHLQSARVFIHMQNVLTITKFQGIDPEAPGAQGTPPLRVITGGIQLVI